MSQSSKDYHLATLDPRKETERKLTFFYKSSAHTHKNTHTKQTHTDTQHTRLTSPKNALGFDLLFEIRTRATRALCVRDGRTD